MNAKAISQGKGKIIYLGTEMLCGLRTQRWRDKNGMTRPFLVDFVQSSVIFSDHKNIFLMILSRNTNQPVVEKRQERIAYSADDHRRLILSDKFGGLSQGIFAPIGE